MSTETKRVYALNVAIRAAVRLGEIVEQQREEITLLKQCHYCHHGDHRHAVDTKRCVNTIERRCQCEEPA